MNITVVGAGNIGLGLVGHISKLSEESVVLYTQRDVLKNGKLYVNYSEENKEEVVSNIRVTNKPKEAFENADIIFCTYPAFLRKKFISDNEKYIESGTKLGFVSGYGGIEFSCKNLINKGVTIFGLQRVPFVARKSENDNGIASVDILSKKKELFVASIPREELFEIAAIVEQLLNITTKIVDEYLSITLTPSNPLLHITGLYNVFKDYMPGEYFDNELKFYEEWNDSASDILFKYDKEVQKICRALPPLDLSSVVSLPLYYESKTPAQLTQKLKSIEAFKVVKVPLKMADNGKYIPDFDSRMFVEDIPYGVCVFKDIAIMIGIETPIIDLMLEFYEKLTGKRYFNKDGSYTEQIYETGVPGIEGIHNVSTLIDYYK